MSVNLAQLLARSAHAFPDLPALALGERILCSYAELAARVARLAAGLAARLAPNERVALVMKNCPQYVELLFACWHAGLCAVPVNAKLHPRELEFILENSGARLCFATADLYDAVAPLAASVDCLEEVIDAGGPRYAALCCRRADRRGRVRGARSGLAVLHQRHHRPAQGRDADAEQRHGGDPQLFFRRRCDRARRRHHPRRADVARLGLLHPAARRARGAQRGAGVGRLRRARDLCAVAGPSRRHHVRRADHGRSAWSIIPRDADTANLKTIVYGGGPMYVADCKAALARFGSKLAQIYGQGESPMTITAMGKAIHADTGHPRYEQRLASVGQAFTGLEVMVADESDRSLPAGEAGEVLVRGDAGDGRLLG